jgi:hypothetical protein
MTTIAFQVPTAKQRRGKPTLKEAHGRVAVLEVGEQKIRFVLQFDSVGKPTSLTHFASGMIFGFLNDEKVRAMCARGTQCKLTDLQAARSLIARIVDKHGLGVVQHKLASAPIINS